MTMSSHRHNTIKHIDKQKYLMPNQYTNVNMVAHLCEDLSEAASKGHDACVRTLVAAGANVNANDIADLGQTPLKLAAHGGHNDCVRMLIDAGANVNVSDIFLITPLILAVREGHGACTQILIDAGANPNVADTQGWSPLHWAGWYGHDACARTLIDAGANVNVTDVVGRTPLYLAARGGHSVFIQKLVNVGANPYVVDNDGKTPLCVAVQKGHKEFVKTLLVCILTERALRDDEWDLISPDSDIGHLLPTVMTRDGRDEAAKLVSKLPEVTRKVLQTAAMCLSRFVHHDVAEQILVRCV